MLETDIAQNKLMQSLIGCNMCAQTFIKKIEFVQYLII